MPALLEVLLPPLASKPTAAPCARCQTTGGFASAPGRRPKRHNGAPYGLDGVLCDNCRSIVRYRTRELAKLELPELPDDGLLPPPLDPPAHVTAAIAERHRVVRDEKERVDRQRRYPGLAWTVLEQRRWGDLAASERRRVVQSRQHARAFA